MKEIIHSDNAPAAVGPYSQATRVGNLVFTAGQIALDPVTMKLTGETVTEQAHQVLTNLKAVLEAAGSSCENVLKTTVYLRYIKDYGEFNTVYSEYFNESKPARSAFAVAALPLGALVEVEAIATVNAVAAPAPVKKPKKSKTKKDKKKKKKGKK